ncbi:MAG: hypothetical protein K2X35_10245 [Bryobacteraceae bacterium]|jgi:hypothetical protein|nr:hypothetical protein [Bryobacteraceae bacterium]
MSDLIPNWAPLETRLAPELCAEFMWMYRRDGVEHYKHIGTRRYLRLTTDGRVEPDTESFEDHWKLVSGRTGGNHEFSC